MRGLVAILKADQSGVALALKQRLISVTCQVYRAWASARGSEPPKLMIINQGWLKKAMPPEVFGGVPGLSAKTASFSEGVSWDVAEACSGPWTTSYVDASKCFDNLRFGDVSAVAKALGAPDAVLKAAGSWLRAHKRTFVAKDCLSRTVQPSRGVRWTSAQCGQGGVS